MSRYPIKKMRVVPKPAAGEGTVIARPPGSTDTDPFMRGTGDGMGDEIYACGRCSAVLLMDLQPGAARGLIFLCPVCGSYNAA